MTTTTRVCWVALVLCLGQVEATNRTFEEVTRAKKGSRKATIDFEDREPGSIVTRAKATGNGESLWIRVCSASFATQERDVVKSATAAMVTNGKTVIIRDLDSEPNRNGGFALFNFTDVGVVTNVCIRTVNFVGEIVATKKDGSATAKVVDAEDDEDDVDDEDDEDDEDRRVCVGSAVKVKVVFYSTGEISKITFRLPEEEEEDDEKAQPQDQVIPPVRDERTVGDLAVFVERKNLVTTTSATIPTLEVATELLDAILGENDLTKLRSVVATNTRGPLTDFTPRFLDVQTLPPITTFAMFPPPNQTSICSLFELFEVYVNSAALNVSFSELEDEIRTEIDLLSEIVDAFPGQFDSCLADFVLEEGDRYDFRSFLYRENFPGVQDGPFVSQFWSIPYLLQQSHIAVAPLIYVEDFIQDTGTMLQYLKAQTHPIFTRDVSDLKKTPSEFSYMATAVHSDALMAFNVKQLDLLLTSTVTRYDCSTYFDDGTTASLQGDFLTCSGCLAFYAQFYEGVRYALLGAFTAKKKFSRVRPEQMAYLIANHLDDTDTSSCLRVTKAECTAEGLSDDVCTLAAQGEPFDQSDLAQTAPFLDDVLHTPEVEAFLTAIRDRQDGCLLLRMLYREGSPTHDAFPGGHSVYAGAVASLLGSMFCLYEDDRICVGRVDETRPPTLLKWSDVRFYNTGANGEPQCRNQV